MFYKKLFDVITCFVCVISACSVIVFSRWPKGFFASEEHENIVYGLVKK